MAVRQRGASWQADVFIGGKRVRKDFATEAAANEWAAKAKPQKASASPSSRPNGPQTGSKSEGPPVLFGDACERTFARYYKGTKWENKTHQMMVRVRADVGDGTMMSEIDANFLDTLIEKYRAEGKAGSTINGRLAFLSKVLRFAKSRGASFDLPRIEREAVAERRMRYLSREEEDTLVGLFHQWGKPDAVDVVICLLDTGVRNSELYALQREDVRMEDGAIFLYGDRNKTKLARTVYMTKRVRAIFERRVQSTAPEGRLFPYDNAWLRTPWDRARALMGKVHDPHFVPYICRHTCASRMVQKGVPLAVIKEWLGHKTIQMTMRYATVAPTNLKSAAEVLDEWAA